MTDERDVTPVRAGAVAIALIGCLAFIIIAGGALYALYLSRAHDARLEPAAVFPAPHLVTVSDGLRDPEIARQQADLERYRWIDPAHGSFQIPIERAMALVAGRGAAAYDPVRAPPEGVKR